MHRTTSYPSDQRAVLLVVEHRQSNNLNIRDTMKLQQEVYTYI